MPLNRDDAESADRAGGPWPAGLKGLAGGHRCQIPRRGAYRAVRPRRRGERIRNRHHLAGDPDRALRRPGRRERGAADAAAGRQWRPPPHEAPLKVAAAMSPRVRLLCATAPFAVLLILGGCTSIGDFGRLQPPLLSDDIHAWVGQEAAAHAGGPVSVNNLTDDERLLRDLAFPLIEPSYDRQRWDAVVYEYGQKNAFRRDLWAFDTAAYYAHLSGEFHRSSAARYNLLIDDMRNDMVRIEPFFETARRVVDIDQRREKSMQYVADLSPAERLSADRK